MPEMSILIERAIAAMWERLFFVPGEYCQIRVQRRCQLPAYGLTVKIESLCDANRRTFYSRPGALAERPPGGERFAGFEDAEMVFRLVCERAI